MMDRRLSQTLDKEERLCGKKDISRLLSKGRFASAGCLRYCSLRNNGADCDRIMVSVPKKLFRRAVKRNLLKRRIRESFRLQKAAITADDHMDIMFVYSSKEMLPFSDIFTGVGTAIADMNTQTGKRNANDRG